MRSVTQFLFAIMVASGLLSTVTADTADASTAVDHVASTAGPLSVGDQFTVDVTTSWDGVGTLTGIFTSTTWDNTQLLLLSIEGPFGPPDEFAGSIYGQFIPPTGPFLPGLSRLGGATQPGDDATSLVRSVQYGTADPNGAPSGGALDDLGVTVLTFQVIGAGDGTAEIFGVIAVGDVPNGAAPIDQTFAFGPAAVVTVPEPISLGLSFAALGTVLAVATRRRRG